MASVPPTDVETTPPVKSEDAGAAMEQKAAQAEAPPIPTESTDAAPTTPAPTKVDAYKPRGIRSKHSALDLVPVLLRITTAVFTLIAFAVIASAEATLVGFKTHFNDYFFFSYLLTVNVITFAYALATIFLSVFLLTKNSLSSMVFIGIFALDQILSYLLISASTSAATGIRIYKPILDRLGASDSFFSKSYAAIAFSFLAFFVLAAAALISGLRTVRRQ